MEAQSPSSEVAGRRSAPVITMGDGVGWAAQEATRRRQARINVAQADTRTREHFIAEPLRRAVGLERWLHFIARGDALQATGYLISPWVLWYTLVPEAIASAKTQGTGLAVCPLKLFALLVSGLLSAEVFHMHISAEAHVIGEIVAGVIRVFVDHDIVPIPEPAVAVHCVCRQNVPVPAVE